MSNIDAKKREFELKSEKNRSEWFLKWKDQPMERLALSNIHKKLDQEQRDALDMLLSSCYGAGFNSWSADFGISMLETIMKDRKRS